MANQLCKGLPGNQNNAGHNHHFCGTKRDHALRNTWDRSLGRKSGRITRSVLLAFAYIAVWSELVVGSLSLTLRAEQQNPTSLGISGRPCQRDSDCPQEQVCATSSDLSNSTQVASWCVCPQGYVLWKWSCHPKILQLGGPCIFSAQCEAPFSHDRRVCDPLSKKCACEFGFVQSADTETCRMDNPMEVTSNPEANLKMELIRQIREDLETRNHTHQDDVVSSDEGGLHPKLLNADQIHTVLYIALALFCVLCVGAISALYMKFMKKKQNNQAAIRGLLDLVSGSDTNSVVGGGSSSGSFDSNTGGIYPHSYVIQPPTLGNGHIQCVDSSIINLDTSRRRQSKILLPALDEDQVVTYPAPHLSMPILPPIRNKPREHKGEDIRFIIPRPRVDGEIETPTIAAITESLNEINNRKSTYQRIMTESAASFPVVDSPPPIPEEPQI